MFPIGNMKMQIRTSHDVGNFVRSARKALGLTQDQLALTSGTNRRFVVELEQGKPTARIGHVLRVLQTLGIAIALMPPPGIDLAAATGAAKSGRRPRSDTGTTSGHGPSA